MFRKRISLLLFPLFLLLSQCRPIQEEKLTSIQWDFSNPEVVKLYNWQDQQKLDSLLAYFNHPDPTYRYGAAMAFASYKEEGAIDSLVQLLNDEVIGVRTAAAFALGQIGSERAESPLIKAFQTKDTLSIADELNGVILEAIGKIGSQQQLVNLGTIKTYMRVDTLLLEGQARGIYNFALRQMIDSNGTDRMVDFIVRRGYPQSVRLIAANYLSRAKGVTLDSLAIVALSKTLAQDVDPNIRMALALGLGKTKSLVAFNAIQNRLNIEKDYRVKCNAIRALANFGYVEVLPIVTSMLEDENQHVASTVANYFVEHGIPRGANFYWANAKDTTLHWQTRMILYKATNKFMPTYFEVSKFSVNREIKQVLATANNPYQKAAALDALAEYNWNYRFIKDQNFDGEEAIIRMASVGALAKIARDPEFVRFFGTNGSKKVKKELADAFEEVIIKRDPAMTAVAAELDFKSYLDSLDFLKLTLEKLSLPREVETYNELKKTIAFFEGKEDNEAYVVPYNHPIDWEIFKGINKKAKAELKTEKGIITLELLRDVAPGTVVNFVQLSKNGFFNGKNFHRVVSNFVIQGGCPRGDGFGALDYTIRSELPPVYFDQGGLMGMASAGNHTECTQFFITHSPTPHLDGNYTIFARVIEGMDVVHQIEQDDVIESVTIL
jgi:cyclophilin family peptidyl-prolyl cis-trans isomerase/HEAT repeat protein